MDTKKNLNLEVETVNELSNDQLDQVAGGSTSAIVSGIVSAITGESLTVVISAAASAEVSHVIEQSLAK